MIDARQAVQVAKQKAVEMLGQRAFNLEELERETYKGRDVWNITLSFIANPEQASIIATFSALAGGALKYKRFLIDVETSDLVAMKLREVATP
jgi:hypothetical protein